jgi:hypothetical protein
MRRSNINNDMFDSLAVRAPGKTKPFSWTRCISRTLTASPDPVLASALHAFRGDHPELLVEIKLVLACAIRTLGAVSPVIIVRAECGLVFHGLDVEVANQVSRKSERSAARLPSSSPRASPSRCIVASISEKPHDGVLPLLPIDALDFSQRARWGTAITAVRASFGNRL